jgi:hypothetical protein
MARRARAAQLRSRMYELLEEGPIRSGASRIVTRALIALILINLLA